MIRLSVTDLESFRYYQDEDEATLEDMIRRLRRLDPPTDQMEAGRAFAKLMEHAGPALDVECVDGWTFRFDGDWDLSLPDLRELKVEQVFQTPSGPVTLVGMVDGTTGRVVRDAKLTQRWDAERYLDSLQWRSYLLMLEAPTFIYDVFVGRYKGKEVTVTEYHPMTFYAYPNMRQDVERAVCELAAFVARHLPDRVAA
jgi:hypothetical protein